MKPTKLICCSAALALCTLAAAAQERITRRDGFRFDFLSNMNISINSREAASFQGEKYVLSNQNKRLFQPGFLVGMGYTSVRVDIGIGTVAYFTSIWNKDSGMFSHVWPLTFELAVRFGRN